MKQKSLEYKKILKDKIYYLNLLGVLANKATCDRKKISAIILKNFTVIATGYNGAPRGVKHCDCLIHEGHCLRTTHAELNCIINSARNGININNSIMIALYKPCYLCMKALINSGIKTCYWIKPYKDDYQKYFEKNKYCKFIKI